MYCYAMRVHASLDRVHNVMIDKLVIVHVHLLQHCAVAQEFMVRVRIFESHSSGTFMSTSNLTRQTNQRTQT